MARFGFVGPSYVSQSPNADDQICKNWYVESIESGQGKSAAALYPTPGLKLFATLAPGAPAGGVRGALNINGRVFFVAAGNLYEVLANGAIGNGGQPWGQVGNDGQKASMAASPNQLAVASAGVVYVFSLNSNTLTSVATFANNGISISQIGFSDGFFIALAAGSQQIYVSNPEDATTWDLTETAIVSVFPDYVISMLVDHREIWLFGATRTQPYYDSGNIFPYDPVPGGFIESGIAAPASTVQLDNSVFWIGADQRGAGVGWRAQGYVPARVSNHAVEFAWQSYPTIADAIGYSYQDQGHSFWVLYFPTANKTWAYDVATQMWHERSFRATGSAADTAHRSRCHVYAFGMHLVGDWASGNVYQMSIPVLNTSPAGDAAWSFADDFGNQIRRVRRAPHVSTEQEWMIHHSLQIDVETGIGPMPPLTMPAPFPQTAAVLADANGNLWEVTVTDAGTIQTTEVSGAAVQPLSLVDQSLGVGQQLGVDTLGRLMVTQLASTTGIVDSLQLATSGTQLYTVLSVVNGQLQTVFPQAYARDPQLVLRWSDDGGKTWSNDRVLNCGQSGNFKIRAIARRLGRSRDRIYELVATDPIPWRIADAYLKADPGFGPVERLTKNLGKQA